MRHVGVWTAALMACAQACAPTPVHYPETVPARFHEAGYLAAVDVADITPPLNLSLFGHGPESRVATGVRLRLRCEVFVIAQPVLADNSEDVIAIVPCDLQSPSLDLQREVAKKLAAEIVPIRADRLFIMATHTHAAPGHYFEARHYSGPFSSMAYGYDPEVVDFLAGRIARAVHRAYDNRKPACLGWKRSEESGLTINRSYPPFLANVGAAALVSAGKVVDPSLFTLRIDRKAEGALDCDGSSLIGVFAVFGMHPTGVSNTNDLYHGDIFGFAVRAAEDRLFRRSREPVFEASDGALGDAHECKEDPPSDVVVGLANGIDGDVSPNVERQSFGEAKRVGFDLGKRIAATALATGPLKGSGMLAHGYWDLRFPGGQYGRDDGKERLCPHAELGMSSAGGAPDGPTRARVIPAANAGFLPDIPDECHGPKLPLRIALGSRFDFPEIGPISVIRIGDGVVATAPGEMTTMTGHRIRKELETRFSPPAPVALVGLTNQYFQYFTTREEYAFQYYEGASNLYGEHTEEFLRRHFGRLADYVTGREFDSKGQSPVNVPAEYCRSPSPVVKFMPANEQAPAVPAQRPLVERKRRDTDIGWEIDVPRLPAYWTSCRWLFRVAILRGDEGREIVDDDTGTNIEVRDTGDHFRIRWMPDEPSWCGQRFRIAVRGRVSIESQAFTLACGGPP